MVEVAVEVLTFELPEFENHSLVFDLYTPWVHQYRILPGHGHMNRLLPHWKEEDYFKFLAGNPTSCPIVLEARYSRGSPDQMKRHSTGLEKFCGVGQIDIYQSLVDMDEDQISEEIEFSDQTGKYHVGKARICVHISFWPELKEKLMSADQRPVSPTVQTLVSSMHVAEQTTSKPSPAMALAAAVLAEGNTVANAHMKMPQVPINSYGGDVIDHRHHGPGTTTTTTTAFKATLFDESPGSPLTFSDDLSPKSA